MAGERTFKTQFLIGAKWVGGAGVQAAQRSLGGLQKTAQRAHGYFRGLGGSIFKGMAAYGVASKAVEAFTTVMVKSIAAATEAQEAHDELSTSIERMAKRYKNTAGKSVSEVNKIVAESTQALIDASEQMERTGHDAEVLQKGWAKLAATGALDPAQILAQRDAFSDVLSYMYGANATAEESVQLGEQWADAILRGNIAVLKRMDLTDGEIQLLKNVNTMVKKGTITGEEGIKRRQALLLKFGKKFEGETKRVFEKPTGKIAQMWTQVGNVLEELGKPFIDLAPDLAASFKKIAVEVKPVAEELAKITAQGLKDFAQWLDKGGAATIVKNLGDIVRGLKGLEDGLNAVNDAATKHDSVWQWLQKVGEPAKLPQLPGAPSQEPVPGGAGTEGEAARRAREGRKINEEDAKRSAEAAKAVGAGWSTQPPQILKDFKIGEETAAAAWQPVATQAASKAAAEAIAQAGDPAHVARVLREAENRSVPATVRNRNPGGMYGGQAAKQFGTIGTQQLLGGKHQIAQFPTAMHGAAANYWNLAHKGGVPRGERKYRPYVGMTIREAMDVWSGGYRELPGPAGNYDPNKVITREMVNDPAFAVPFLKAIASGEAPHGERVMTDEQWKTAHQWFMAGKPGGGGPTTAPSSSAVAKQTPPSETVRKAEAVHKTNMLKLPPPLPPSLTPTPAGPAPAAGAAARPSPEESQLLMENAMMKLPGGPGSSLNRQIKEMNLNQRTSGATGGTNVAVNPTINVNGVAPGREALMAKKTALALRDPVAEGLRQLKEMKAQSARVGYV